MKYLLLLAMYLKYGISVIRDIDVVVASASLLKSSAVRTYKKVRMLLTRSGTLP